MSGLEPVSAAAAPAAPPAALESAFPPQARTSATTAATLVSRYTFEPPWSKYPETGMMIRVDTAAPNFRRDAPDRSAESQLLDQRTIARIGPERIKPRRHLQEE